MTFVIGNLANSMVRQLAPLLVNAFRRQGSSRVVRKSIIERPQYKAKDVVNVEPSMVPQESQRPDQLQPEAEKKPPK